MKLTYLPSEFQKALPVLEKLKKAGFEAYFIGGSVRDALLGRQIHDVDIATSAYPEETKSIFLRTVDVGIEHGTVLVLTETGEYEVTTFRTEDVYVDFRRPSRVSFVRSLEEDLKRRDFTVNAFALNDQGDVIDLFAGLKDLENRLLRAVGQPEERFNEDALRIMRGLRFAASLDFEIDPTTFAAMCSHAPLLEKISVERSFIEFDKLLSSPYWRKGLHYFIMSKAYVHLPNMADKLSGFEKLLTSVGSSFVFETSEQAWAALMIHLDVSDVTGFLKAWKTSVAFQKTVTKLVEIYHLRQKGNLKQYDVYNYGQDLLLLVEKLRQGMGQMTDFARIEALEKQLTIHDKHEIVVNGGLLMSHFEIKPGPNLGTLLNTIELKIVEGDLANTKEAIFAFVEQYLQQD